MNNLICRFNDETQIFINACVIPNPDIIVIYENIMNVISDLQVIRPADKSFVMIRDLEGRQIYEFYNMELSSTQILENGDGTITVHYYFREIG